MNVAAEIERPPPAGCQLLAHLAGDRSRPTLTRELAIASVKGHSGVGGRLDTDLDLSGNRRSTTLSNRTATPRPIHRAMTLPTTTHRHARREDSWAQS